MHDNLDSNWVWFKVLAESGEVFGAQEAIIPNIMGGRATQFIRFRAQRAGVAALLLSPFAVYVANQILIVFFAFLGMFLLLDRHILRQRAEPESTSFLARMVIINGVAACFALLPHWPPGGLSVAGMPSSATLTLSADFALSSASFRIHMSPRSR